MHERCSDMKDGWEPRGSLRRPAPAMMDVRDLRQSVLLASDDPD